jgi:predicted ribosome quality control (RQC) complex YloA/Tae2 family protein
MMQQTKHKLEKELKRAERHKEWLKKNLPNTDIERENQKKLLLLYTNLRMYQT